MKQHFLPAFDCNDCLANMIMLACFALPAAPGRDGNPGEDYEATAEKNLWCHTAGSNA
jgi:hypothetical protein